MQQDLVDARTTANVEALMSGIRPLLEKASPVRAPQPNGRRFVIIHVDGLSRELLFRAMREGHAPFMKRLSESRGYSLSPMLAGAPASTPAFQAGLLYGARNPDIPGFMWFDGETLREIRMDDKIFTSRLESQLRRTHQSLVADGSVNYSIFTGGAEVNAFT